MSDDIKQWDAQFSKIRFPLSDYNKFPFLSLWWK